ncbi:chemotaxis protein CheW [Sphingomonas sp. PR090111-T3T-6A]|uniref:chemotaxis protein CheW n=1 Tax=Sphingomonas sp. PR090111-T3T-6A TaxID=685778 RepID=UPI0003775E05|nr:chemotaxis protein CheW [Sphingomonas sp. PR090111-T3T-6A]
MLFVLFQIGEAGYALAASQVAEILPMTELRAVRGAPPGMAGSLRYRGVFMPVVDLCVLERGEPACDRMSTRIIVTRVADREGAERPLGLIVENATDILRCEPEAFAPFATGPRGLVERADVDALVPEHLRFALFDAMAVG